MFEGKQSNLPQFSLNRTYCVTSNAASKSNSFTSFFFHFALSVFLFLVMVHGETRMVINQRVCCVHSDQLRTDGLPLRVHSMLSTSENLLASFGAPVKVEFLWKSVCHDRDALEDSTIGVWNCNKNFTKQQSLKSLCIHLFSQEKQSAALVPWRTLSCCFLNKNVAWYSPKYKL